MANHPNRSAKATIRRHMTLTGCSDAQIKHGIEWADEQGFSGARDGYILAMSRVLYDDGQLEEGARFSVEVGSGPR